MQKRPHRAAIRWSSDYSETLKLSAHTRRLFLASTSTPSAPKPISNSTAPDLSHLSEKAKRDVDAKARYKARERWRTRATTRFFDLHDQFVGLEVNASKNPLLASGPDPEGDETRQQLERLKLQFVQGGITAEEYKSAVQSILFAPWGANVVKLLFFFKSDD